LSGINHRPLTNGFPGMTRLIQSILVTGFFLVMMAMLVRDQVIPSFKRSPGVDVDHNVLTDSWSNQDDWLEIRVADFPVGVFRTTAEKDEVEDFYTNTAQLQIDTPFLRGRMVSIVRLNRRLEVESARIRGALPGAGEKLLSAEELDAEALPPGAIEATALSDGRNLRVRIRRGDAERYTSVRLARPITVADSITPILRTNMLSKGIVYRTDVYDPLWGNSAGQIEVEYMADRQERDQRGILRLREIELRLANMKTTLWVNPQGVVVRREIPLLQPGNSPGSEEMAKGFSIVMTRLDPVLARSKHAGLDYEPRPPVVNPGDVVGKDKGDLGTGISAFSLLSKGLESRLKGGSK